LSNQSSVDLGHSPLPGFPNGGAFYVWDELGCGRSKRKAGMPQTTRSCRWRQAKIGQKVSGHHTVKTVAYQWKCSKWILEPFTHSRCTLKHYKNRLICFLDVLGYSAMIEKVGIEEIYTKYSQFVDIAKNKVFFGTPDDYEGPSNNFEISEIVSDSILLVSHDIENVASVNNFIGSIHFFLELGLASGFMFRGCVSQGEIIFDEHRGIFLSKEFNELAKFEPKMNAPVCVIFEEAKAIVLSSLFGAEVGRSGVMPSKSLPIVKWSVPLKDQIAKDLWCINYTFFCDKQQMAASVEYLAGDLIKQKNFIDYLEFLKAFPEDRLISDSTNSDGNYLKIMKSRSGMRVAFANGVDEIMQPTIQWGFPSVFIELPEEIIMQVDPRTGQVKFTAKGRWY
jgi:hypothetical protein